MVRLYLKRKWDLSYDNNVVADGSVVVDQERFIKHNVGQISLFRVVGREETCELMVAHTHLFWNPQVRSSGGGGVGD